MADTTALVAGKSFSEALRQVLDEGLGFKGSGDSLLGVDEVETAVLEDLDRDAPCNNYGESDSDADEPQDVLGTEPTLFGQNKLSLRLDDRPEEVVARSEIDAFERRLAQRDPSALPPPPSVTASREWSTQADELARLPPQRRTLPVIRRALRDIKVAHMHVEALDAALEQLPNLVELNACDNRIRAIEHLPPALELLWLASNDLDEIGEHPVLAQLMHLCVAFNRVTRIPEVLLRSEHLASLDLSYNQLCDLDEVLDLLRTLPVLHHLFLAGNPLALEPFYRALCVRESSESLLVMDDLPVLPQERLRIAHAGRMGVAGAARFSVAVRDVEGLFAPDGAPVPSAAADQQQEEDDEAGAWPTDPAALLAARRPLTRVEIEVPGGDVDATPCRAWSSYVDFATPELQFELPLTVAVRDAVKFLGVRLFMYKSLPPPPPPSEPEPASEPALEEGEGEGEGEGEEAVVEPFDGDAVMADALLVGTATLDLSAFLTPQLVGDGGALEQTAAGEVPLELDEAFLVSMVASTRILPDITLGLGDDAEGGEQEGEEAVETKKDKKDKKDKKKDKKGQHKKEGQEAAAAAPARRVPTSVEEQRPVVRLSCRLNKRSIASRYSTPRDEDL